MLSFSQLEGYINLRTKILRVDRPVIKIDTFSIQPFYFEVFDEHNQLIDEDKYQVNFEYATLHFLYPDAYKNQIIKIKYLVYPAFLRKSYQIYDKSRILNLPDKKISFDTEKHHSPKPLGGLKTSGSISRGFSAGNNQSVVMQSEMDLQINGKLSDKINIKAVLSDSNMPQAYAGISQSYKEFDRIYMQLIGQNWQATGGDILMQSKSSYFMKFLRKTQGLDIEIGKDSSRIQVSGGYVDGQFGINKFQGVEGNQGPYILTGNQGERYIFIIANSEKVYINGKLLKRGETHDYIIRYETAELLFNTRFPITQNMRITVEFNYSNQHYMRYLNHNTYHNQGKKLDFSIYTYLEYDAKNKTLLYELDKQQRQTLKNAGDNAEELFVLSAKQVPYNENKILYQKIFTGNNFHFKYTRENLTELYEVRFSYIGKNKGSYALNRVIATGKIFEFVGENMGDYEPKIKLNAPQSRNYVGAGFNYHPNRKTQIDFEGLINYSDLNLFSTKDEQDNLGFATHLDFRQQLWQKKNRQLNAHLHHDFTHRNFMALDPYRDPEFSRQWQIDSIFGRQHLLDIGLSYNEEKNFAESGIRYFELRDSVKAGQEYFNTNWQYKKLKILSEHRLTQQESGNNKQMKIAYFHQSLQWRLKNFNIQTNGHYEERNQQLKQISDTLNYRYKFGEIFIEKRDSSHIGFRLGYKAEQNDSIRWNRFFRAENTHNIYAELKRKKENSKIDLYLNYRHSKYYFDAEKKDYLNIKFSWQQFLYHKFLMTNIQIETFNGNTLLDEITFVETPVGQGTHQWIDYNNNGIKEINEFEVATYQDQANYIRVILPSKNYMPTVNNSYEFQLIINPKAIINKGPASKLYNIFQFGTKHQATQKNEFIPLIWQPENPLSQNNIIQNDLFFNRTKRKYFVHFSYQNLAQKQILLVGKQAHELERFLLETKHAFLPNLIWKQKFISANNRVKSENYQSKNYRLRTREIKQKIDFKQAEKAVFSIFYHWKDKSNLSSVERLKMHRLGLSYLNKDTKNNIFQTEINFVLNRLSGNPNSPVSFQMLEALRNGKNLIFMALYRKKLTSYLEMNLGYNFRLAEDTPAIHTGNIQLKMIF